MRDPLLVTDLVIAVIVAAIVMIVSPGVAITGMVALLALLALGVSHVWRSRRR
jgi:hypothetical protein